MKKLKKRIRRNQQNSIERYASGCWSSVLDYECSLQCGGTTGNAATGYAITRDMLMRSNSVS